MHFAEDTHPTICVYLVPSAFCIVQAEQENQQESKMSQDCDSMWLGHVCASMHDSVALCLMAPYTEIVWNDNWEKTEEGSYPLHVKLHP